MDRTYHHGDLRRALVEAATTLLRDGGVDALTLRGAARKAGVTHAAPYRHFSDKAALVAAVAEDAFVSLNSDLESVLRSAGPKLKALCVVLVRFAARRPAEFRLLVHPSRSNGAGLDSRRGVIEQAFLRGAEHDVSSEGVRGSPQDLASLVWSVARDRALDVADGRETPESVTRIWDILDRALTPR